MEQPKYHGSCLCEAVKFEARGDPEKVIACHCIDCKKNAGGPYQMLARFDRDNISVQGFEPAAYVVKNTTSGIEKHKIFCPQCGCTLWTLPMAHKGQKMIVRTSLIDGGLESLRPEAEFFAASRVSYIPMIQGAKEFATMPGH